MNVGELTLTLALGGAIGSTSSLNVVVTRLVPRDRLGHPGDSVSTSARQPCARFFGKVILGQETGDLGTARVGPVVDRADPR